MDSYFTPILAGYAATRGLRGRLQPLPQGGKAAAPTTPTGRGAPEPGSGGSGRL